MLSRIGLFSVRDLSSASGPHANQSTGLFACWSRYGLVSFASRLGIVRTVGARQFVDRYADTSAQTIPFRGAPLTRQRPAQTGLPGAMVPASAVDADRHYDRAARHGHVCH